MVGSDDDDGYRVLNESVAGATRFFLSVEALETRQS
jgi:hypothetical protein